MYFDRRALMLALAREVLSRAGALARTVVRRILPGACALILAIGAIGLGTYESAYTDASGSRCLAFAIGNREADLCSGDMNRPAPWPAALPVAYPFDWHPADASTSTEGGGK